jgi:hypothetical protein
MVVVNDHSGSTDLLSSPCPARQRAECWVLPLHEEFAGFNGSRSTTPASSGGRELRDRADVSVRACRGDELGGSGRIQASSQVEAAIRPGQRQLLVP